MLDESRFTRPNIRKLAQVMHKYYPKETEQCQGQRDLFFLIMDKIEELCGTQEQKVTHLNAKSESASNLFTQ